MKKSLSFFPTISGLFGEEIIEKLNPKVTFLFFYAPKNEIELETIKHKISNNRHITLDVKDNHWDPNNYDLYMRVNLEVSNATCLYGVEGIAPDSSDISFCLEWYSQKSKRRGLSSPKIIKNSNDKQTFVFESVFNRNTFMYDIDINIFAFLSKSSKTLKEGEEILNNFCGVNLGTIDSKVLYLSGTGSLFPIFTKYIPGKKLWDIEISYDDPTIDKFSDSVKIILNEAHKDYKYLDVSNKHYCDRLISEIIAEAMSILIIKLKDEGYFDTNLSNQYCEGSIMSFVKYYHNILGLEIDDITKISSSLRDYLEGDE